ncbi:MAG: DUF1127 domain-containing protein [Pseudomonadota bacterium]|nr:DUF1127 domain-containing protein [Pseudomonadota bacterium]
MSTIDTIQSRWGGAAVVVGPSVSTAAYKLFRAVEAFAMAIGAAVEMRRSRRALLQLTDHQLEDIGITRADALNEAKHSFWR